MKVRGIPELLQEQAERLVSKLDGFRLPGESQPLTSESRHMA
jgi:hypothetical protein